jgi:ubiquinone/menaquinone biosynthesis C-methylase UbiE
MNTLHLQEGDTTDTKEVGSFQFNNDKNLNTKNNWNNLYHQSWLSSIFNGNHRQAGTNYMKSIVPYVNSAVEDSDKLTIIDFGCGLGYGTVVIRKTFPNAKVIGVDHSETAITFCRKKWGNVAEFQLLEGSYSTNKQTNNSSPNENYW